MVSVSAGKTDRGGETRYRFAAWAFLFRRETLVSAGLLVLVIVFQLAAQPKGITGPILIAMTAALTAWYLIAGAFALICRSPLVITRNELRVWTGGRTIQIRRDDLLFMVSTAYPSTWRTPDSEIRLFSATTARSVVLRQRWFVADLIDVQSDLIAAFPQLSPQPSEPLQPSIRTPQAASTRRRPDHESSSTAAGPLPANNRRATAPQRSSLRFIATLASLGGLGAMVYFLYSGMPALVATVAGFAVAVCVFGLTYMREALDEMFRDP
jgi:hypothetical protein